MELAGIALFQRPRTSSITGSEPRRVLPMVMAEAPRLRGALRPAEGEAWNWSTSTSASSCWPAQIHGGTPRHKAGACAPHTVGGPGKIAWQWVWRQGGGPFLPSTCIITIVAVWATVTEHHRLGGLSHTHLRLTVLETRKYKIKAPADLVSGESLLPGLLVLTWQKPEQTEREKKQAFLCLMRALVPL